MLSLTVAMLAAALAPATTGAPAAGFDFGDAPDGAPARYVEKPAVRGMFPSRAVRGGPRHGPSGPRIGIRWTGESDSRQVDRDTDDGAQLDLRACALSTLTVAIDASRVAPGAELYVNAWFDWNQDGDWAEGGTSRCGPEWGIQNVKIDPSSLGAQRVGLVKLRLRAGKVPSQFWWRVQVHVGEPVRHAGGADQAAATAGGETEDLLFDRPPRRLLPPLRVRCDRPFGVVTHGGTYDVDFSLGGELAVTDVDHALIGDKDGLQARLLSLPFDRWRVKVRTREHGRQPVLQIAGVSLAVEGFVQASKRRLKASCTFYVVHAKPVAPPYQPPPNTDPPPAGAAIDPIRPDPVKARCAARFDAEGWPGNYTPGVAGASGGFVRVRCAGIDLKSFSISAGPNDQKIAWWQEPIYETGTERCAAITVSGSGERRALRCVYEDPSVTTGFDPQVTYATDKPFGSTTLHVLAGGFSRGGTGTTIVLRQTFFFLREGVRCSQSVPAAPACATLPPP